MDTAELEAKVHSLETALAVQEANLAGAQATQAATHSGTWSVIVAGAASLVVGIALGVTISKS
ncbi:hypothetical protein [Kitasatospora purpeofusca]|uniref:hypothetical protein n=1 Tax=Kitasatospora purpeofusca TaxID=67352 RepID=UPI0036BF5321